MKSIYVTRVSKKWYVDIPDKQYTGAFNSKAKVEAFLKPAERNGYRVEFMKPAKVVKGYKGNPPYGYGAHENPMRRRNKVAKVKAKKKKRPVNLNMIAGAVKSKKTPPHLKKGLLAKYGAALKAKGLIT